MVMTKMPPRIPSKMRAHLVLAEPENFEAKKGKSMKMPEPEDDLDSPVLSDLLSAHNDG